MRRREFFKYLASMGIIGCASCLWYSNSNIIDVSSETFRRDVLKYDILDTIKYPIVHHCNLNCAYCSHFSPIAEPFEIPVKNFERDIKQLAKISNGKFRVIDLFGGEPLLHKNIEELIKISRNYLPNTRIKIATNGLLLRSMPKSFWDTCRKYNVNIAITIYPLYKNALTVEECEKMQATNKVSLSYSHEYSTKLRFDLMNLHKAPSSIDNYKYCDAKMKCLQVDNGRLYPCPIIAHINIFNKYFKDYALPTFDSDSLDIYSISNKDDIYNFLQKNKKLCRHCEFGMFKQSVPWTVTNHDVSEWYRV